MDLVDKVLQIVADEAGIRRDELTDDSEFSDLGIDDILAKSIISRVRQGLQRDLPLSIFVDNPAVADLKRYLNKSTALHRAQNGRPSGSAPAKSAPLSIVLQGKPDQCRRTIFLLPDGSGAAMAYARLPRLDVDTCVIGLNSPYLRAGNAIRFNIEQIAELWANEIQQRQPTGACVLGGWSAGGYYAFEVTKCLMSRGRTVSRLLLIDSPCRLIFEALPMDVVQHLSNNNLMGNWGNKQPPGWLIDHFEISIRAIENYMPTALEESSLPEVFIIWAQDGLIEESDQVPFELDMNVKVTRMLIQRPQISGALGWDLLFPGGRVRVAKMPGNHFTLVHPPHVDSLGELLRDVMKMGTLSRQWQEIRPRPA